MPIRLISFKADGTDIRLVERGDIWQDISTHMEKDYNTKETMINLSIQNQIKEGGKTRKIAEEVFVSEFTENYNKFAILSHTWLQNTPGEVTYSQWKAGNFDKTSVGYRKLTEFCRVAATEYGYSFGWMDTLCINKESSSELDESIRSMYNWYGSAATCITYLADTIVLSDMHKDAWFTRGWTLQELIAPRLVKFHGSSWKRVVPWQGNDKDNADILQQILVATTITKDELKQHQSIIPISRRMQWAAHRRVTREEDTAYSLMGIFDVSISIAYGEGAERAFVRLLKEVINTNATNMLDVVNWGHGDSPGIRNTAIRTSALLPPSPKQYLQRYSSPAAAGAGTLEWHQPSTPIILTHLGLHMPVLITPGIVTARLSPAAFTPKGKYYASATRIGMFNPTRSHISVQSFNILAKSIFDGSAEGRAVTFFGILNAVETPNSIQLPARGLCYAVPMQITPSPVRGSLPERPSANPLATVDAVVFELKRDATTSLTIPKNELGLHGMTFRTMYL